jgi:hypothetical protein
MLKKIITFLKKPSFLSFRWWVIHFFGILITYLIGVWLRG